MGPVKSQERYNHIMDSRAKHPSRTPVPFAWKAFVSVFLVALVAGGCADEHASIQAVRVDECVVDGLLSESVWEQAIWTELEGSNFPVKAKKGQGKSLTRAAAAWNTQGLFIAMRTEDSDVQGNKTKPNDWIWIEDVLEVFIAPSNQPGVLHAEFQVNPAGTEFFNRQEGASTIPQPTAVKGIPHTCSARVEGTLNESSTLDKGYSAEWFFAWEDLKRAGLLRNDFVPAKGEVACSVRFATWDLNVYTPLRTNRWTLPGDDNPHETQYYIPVVLVEKR